VVVDRLATDEKWRNLTPLVFEDYLEADDLRSRISSGVLGAFDTLFHLGACSSTTEKDATFLIRNNFEFTKDLAYWALENQSRCVYASSAATYGDGAHGMDDTAPIQPLRPLNMYGYSKHLFDLHAQSARILDELTGLKYFNVFGPNEHHKGEMRSLVHKATTQAQEEGVIRLFKSYRPEFADGEQERDFLYVKDAVRMTLHLASRPVGGGLYNLGSGTARTWKALAKAVFAALGKEPQIEFIEMPEVLRGKYQYRTCASLAKLRATGYSAPVTPLEEAVSDYVQEYLVPGRYLGDERIAS
jgi:ADP-L-glycero-D-manno-heptose 6-epimerase